MLYQLRILYNGICNTQRGWELQNFYRNTWREYATWGDLSADKRMKSEWVLEKYGVNLWNGFNWLRIGSNGRLVLTWYIHTMVPQNDKSIFICWMTMKFLRKTLQQGVSEEPAQHNVIYITNNEIHHLQWQCNGSPA